MRIEKLQKVSLYVILGNIAHSDYLCNLAILNLELLDERRQKIASNFAKKILKHPEHRKMFTFIKSNKTKSGEKVLIPFCRTSRYENSFIPSLAKIINDKLTHRI